MPNQTLEQTNQNKTNILYTKFITMQTCNIHKYGNIFKYQYTQVKIYNMCGIYKTQKQRNYRNSNSIKH